ncbi:hypothetical protein [Actinomyces oris]|uniref:hypothetical protein n=1 Tax=Actinomyces oris TaxID=544580 RepID=UPI0022FD5F15|nr:hypothetical protein [Actinomyces oris]WCA41940.1 hypothetical protein PGE45_07275 [Actinomyces oris]
MKTLCFVKKCPSYHISYLYRYLVVHGICSQADQAHLFPYVDYILSDILYRRTGTVLIEISLRDREALRHESIFHPTTINISEATIETAITEINSRKGKITQFLKIPELAEQVRAMDRQPWHDLAESAVIHLQECTDRMPISRHDDKPILDDFDVELTGDLPKNDERTPLLHEIMAAVHAVASTRLAYRYGYNCPGGDIVFHNGTWGSTMRYVRQARSDNQQLIEKIYAQAIKDMMKSGGVTRLLENLRHLTTNGDWRYYPGTNGILIDDFNIAVGFRSWQQIASVEVAEMLLKNLRVIVYN